MKNKLPNFFIVGAAKCGTTSLYHYLKSHSEIFLPSVKEPKFITSQLIKFPLCGIQDHHIEDSMINNFNDYRKLYSTVKDERAIGDASIDNLYYYQKAVPFIKQHFGNPRIIIVLRNPIDRAFSNYKHMFFSGRESLDFHDAIQKENERRRLNWEYFWHYVHQGFYHAQVKTYLDNFNRVKIYLFEELKEDMSQLLKDICRFLDVNDKMDFNIETKYNVHNPKQLNKVGKYLKKTLLTEFVVHYLSNEQKKMVPKILNKFIYKEAKLRPATYKYLCSVYREDILRLQDLLQRELTHWLSP